MEIGIIGSGNIGSTLAGIMTKLGHRVKIANSRGPESLKTIAQKTGALPVTAPEAAGSKDLVIIAIPEKEIINLPINILSPSSAIIIDAGNYYPSRDGQIAEIENGLAESQWVAKVIGHPVIKAINNITAPSLASNGLPAGSPNRIALSVVGNNDKENQIVMDLIDKIGFDVIDGGLLSDSWRQEP